MTLSLETVQHLADQLPPLDQARLIEHLSRQLAMAALAQPSPPEPARLPAAWTHLFAISDDIRATYPDASPAARLEADRRERDAAAGETRGETDVHA